VSCSEREQDQVGGTLRRGTWATAANSWLYAPGEGSRALRLAAAYVGGQGPSGRGPTASQVQQKLDRLDEAFLSAQTIDLTSYERQRDKLREELTLAQIDHHAESIEEPDVQGILAFAERVLPRAADLWVQASLNQKQRLQQLFLPEGIAFERKSI
jgi:hypothetical protein